MMSPERLGTREQIESAVRKENRRRQKLRFQPGVLEGFHPVLARVLAKATDGKTGWEAGFQSSLRAKMTPQEAIAWCRTHGIGTKPIVRALVEPATLKAKGFGDLGSEAVEGIEAMLSSEINDLFWHRSR